jgi:hypothetical protein
MTCTGLQHRRNTNYAFVSSIKHASSQVKTALFQGFELPIDPLLLDALMSPQNTQLIWENSCIESKFLRLEDCHFLLVTLSRNSLKPFNLTCVEEIGRYLDITCRLSLFFFLLSIVKDSLQSTLFFLPLVKELVNNLGLEVLKNHTNTSLGCQDRGCICK